MEKIKKIETNDINSLFLNYEIENEQMTNILGGVMEIRITVKCSTGETLKRADHAEKCSASNTTLNVGCASGATLCAVILSSTALAVSQTAPSISVTNIE